MNATEINNKAAEKLATRTIAQLIALFELTDNVNVDGISTVRGWIMDELERRDAAAFEIWMDDENFIKSPREFFTKAA